MRMKFNELFELKEGMITPRVNVHINGTTMGNGTSFGNGVSFGGVNLFELINKEFDVKIENNVYILLGVY